MGPEATVNPIPYGLFLLVYFIVLGSLAVLGMVLVRRFEHQGRKRAAWAVTGIALLVVILHWTWPMLLR